MAALVHEGCQPFELAVPCEVFGIDRSYLGIPWYRLLVVASSPPPVRTSVGFTIDTPHTLDALDEADTVVVPAWQVDQEPPPELLDALRAAAHRGARLMSVCSGAFVLAAAGLLDGRRATTHWMYADELARRHPEIEVVPDVLYVDEGSILTSAGTAAGIDLCLHVVRCDHGAEVANAVARRMVVPPHRDGGQAQYVDAPLGDGAGSEHDRLTDTLTWMQAHLADDVTVADLARRSAMSPRTFARRFRAATGSTPHRWLTRQRVIAAQRLLETTGLPIEEIARRTGFGTATNLRQHFRRETRTSPTAYRRTFSRAG